MSLGLKILSFMNKLIIKKEAHMNTLERVQKEMELKEKQKQLSVLLEIEKSYAKLDFTYHITLFASGICLILYFGYLSWVTGIGWFFFSRFISLLITRLDVIQNESNVIKELEIKSNSKFKPWFN